MAFAITENNGTFGLRGNLTVGNAYILRKHFELIFKTKEMLTINLSALDSIDSGSVFELENLRNFAYQNHKVIVFVGEKNSKIKGAFLRARINILQNYQKSA
ncbi:hypothetical protein [Mesonia aestuariivivens]|uniref:STAS domain-containing protein n=1 Tax=Mesonia aestuariivivens TaxID=2796128 RepID=A0ABS6W4N0_9FLAO|nr:hypothetical protein [Mesonia aestuariivivens]MBW2962826.1 hypothetical protein [Mesonia aestuariivivens]